VVRHFLPGHNLDSQEAISHNELGLMDMHRGRYREAIPHFERAHQLLPKHGEIDANLKMARAMEAATEARYRR